MKRALRWLVFFVVIGASTMLSNLEATGLPICESLHGNPCAPPGATTQCVWSNGDPGFCRCLSTKVWRCIR